MIPLGKVVDSVVTGIERRADLIVPTRQNAVAARIPELVRPIVDRFGFRGTAIPDTTAQASASGWETRR